MARAHKKTNPGASKPKTNLVLEKSAGAVVFHRGATVEYLLIRQTHWEFPKGLVDSNETELEAAVREVREETGLEVALVPGYRETIQYFYRHKGDSALVKKQVVYFLGETKTQESKLSWEHQEARWVSFDAAIELLDYENAREILRKANDRVLATAT